MRSALKYLTVIHQFVTEWIDLGKYMWIVRVLMLSSDRKITATDNLNVDRKYDRYV